MVSALLIFITKGSQELAAEMAVSGPMESKRQVLTTGGTVAMAPGQWRLSVMDFRAAEQ